MTEDHVASLIAAEYAGAFGYFRMFAPPASHAWISDTSGLSWFADDLRPPAEHSASIHLRRMPPDDSDDRQLQAKIRLFWDRAADGGPVLTGRRASLTGTCSGRSLLDDSVRHYQSIAMTRICSAIACDLVAAIRRHGAGFATM